MSSCTSSTLDGEVSRIIRKPNTSGKASLMNMKTTAASREWKPAWRSLRVVWSAAAPRSRFMRSAKVRSKPSDAAFGDGLADRVCSLRVFMRRVRKALSRASIGGCQTNAVHNAQNATKVAMATTTVKLFSESTRSMASPQTLMVAIRFMMKMPTPMLQPAAAATI